MQDYTADTVEPDYAPRENRVCSEPPTVAACQQDYADAADVRAVLARQERA